MRPPLRTRWVRALLLGGIVVGLVGCISRPMIFPGCEEGFPPDGRLEAPPGGAARVVRYTVEDGLELEGALVTGPPVRDGDGERRPLAVYFHGNAESAAQNVDLARALAARGVDVFLCEYRGYGGGPGSPCEDGLLQDARAAIACAAREARTPESDVILIGRSLGTGVAAAMAAEGRGRAVLLLSPYTSILELAADMVGYPVAWLFVSDTFRSRERLLAARQRVAIVHGTRDEVIPFAHGEALAAALGPRATLTPVPFGHNDLLRAFGVVADELARIEQATRPGR